MERLGKNQAASLLKTFGEFTFKGQQFVLILKKDFEAIRGTKAPPSDEKIREILASDTKRIPIEDVLQEFCRNRIAELRKKAGLSQSQLAELVGVTQHNISRWEKGQIMPNAKSLVKLTRALNCKIGDLLGPKEE